VGYGIDRGFGYANSPSEKTVCDIAEEVIRARTKFPSSAFMLAALTEEVGECARAMLQGRRDDARKEAMQVACCAIRIIEEYDTTFDQLRPENSLP